MKSLLYVAVAALLSSFAGGAFAGERPVGFIVTPEIETSDELRDSNDSLGEKSNETNLQSNEENIFERVSTLKSAELSQDGQTVTVPVLLKNGDVVLVTLDRNGKVQKVVRT